MKDLKRIYRQIKEKYKDYIVLLQHDNMYITFDKDAIECSTILKLPLAKNEDKIVKFLSSNINKALPKFIKANKKVAICNNPFLL